MGECLKGVYRPRNPGKTAFWRLVHKYYQKFEEVYEERYAKTFGHFRSVIREVVTKYLSCGDLRQGFARLKCSDCGTDGAFNRNGLFFVLPKVSLARMEQLFRHRVLKMLLDEKKIQERQVKMLLGWKNSGFNMDSSIRVAADDSRSSHPISYFGNSNFPHFAFDNDLTR